MGEAAMQRVILLVLMLCALGFSGCAGDKGKELFETAQFEEKQHNLEHAKQLYGEIAQKYPGSDYARKAEERLAALKAESREK
jgi:outer membrane protein assembly factor BamD (BamD/ComL family)